MLNKKDIQTINSILDTTTRPIIFFDDDPDGLCSFLMIYSKIKEGKGIPIKTNPKLDTTYLHKVQEFAPDRIIILDKPLVDETFIKKTKIKILWIDHHPIPEESRLTDYFNPLKNDPTDNSPTSYNVYSVLKNNNPKIIWLSMVGCIADWFIPDFKDEFANKFPDLFDKNINDPAEALFTTKIGLLAKIFNSCLKGTKKKIDSCIKTLIKIESPYEILEQSTSRGKFVYKHFLKLNKEYDELLNSIKPINDEFIAFQYTSNSMSFTSMLSNEVLFRNPDKFILIAREKNGFMHCSLRSKKHNVRAILEKVLPEFTDAYGGGHIHACGANIRKDEFQEFINALQKELSNKNSY